ETQRGIAVPRAQRLLDPVAQRAEELVLRANLAEPRLSLDVLDEAHGDRHAEVGVEEELLQLLDRPFRHAPLLEDADVGEGEIFDALPERTLGNVVGAAENASHGGES